MKRLERNFFILILFMTILASIATMGSFVSIQDDVFVRLLSLRWLDLKEFFQGSVRSWPIFYFLFYSSVGKIFSSNYETMQLATIALSYLTVIPVLGIARALYKDANCWFVGILYLCFPFRFWIAVNPSSESLYLFLLLSGLWLYLRFFDRRTIALLVISGFFFSLAAMTRLEMWPLLPVLALGLFWQDEKGFDFSNRNLAIVVLFSFFAGLGVAIVLYRSWSFSGDIFAMLQSNDGDVANDRIKRPILFDQFYFLKGPVRILGPLYSGLLLFALGTGISSLWRRRLEVNSKRLVLLLILSAFCYLPLAWKLLDGTLLALLRYFYPMAILLLFAIPILNIQSFRLKAATYSLLVFSLLATSLVAQPKFFPVAKYEAGIHFLKEQLLESADSNRDDSEGANVLALAPEEECSYLLYELGLKQNEATCIDYDGKKHSATGKEEAPILSESIKYIYIDRRSWPEWNWVESSVLNSVRAQGLRWTVVFVDQTQLILQIKGDIDSENPVI